jgi:hypothetical protein
MEIAMHNLSVATLAASALAAISFTPVAAQVTTPAPSVEFMHPRSDSVLSKNLIGLSIYNGANEDVGAIKDIVVENGLLKGYILSVGGFLGMGTHYVTVSPSSVAINYDTKNKKWHATINATKDQLKAAPEFRYEGALNE